MKKRLLAAALGLLLCGCGSQETYETIADELVQPVMAIPRQISVRLPDHAVAPTAESGMAQIYFCEDYEIVLETVSSGDLGETIRHISGYTKENLTLMQTAQDGADRYEFVWACAGETGDRLGRAVILDDGQYHYCMSVLRDADSEGKSQVVWSDVFASFGLI